MVPFITVQLLLQPFLFLNRSIVEEFPTSHLLLIHVGLHREFERLLVCLPQNFLHEGLPQNLLFVHHPFEDNLQDFKFELFLTG